MSSAVRRVEAEPSAIAFASYAEMAAAWAAHAASAHVHLPCGWADRTRLAFQTRRRLGPHGAGLGPDQLGEQVQPHRHHEVEQDRRHA